MLMSGGLGAVLAPFGWGNGLFFDLAVALKTPSSPPPAAHTVVIALDDRSLDAPELTDIPRPLMQPRLAEVIAAAIEAGARVVSLDLLLSYSGNRLINGHDRPLLAALYAGRDRIVLGRSAGSMPADPFVAALGFGPGDLGLMELEPDPDGIYRHVSTGSPIRQAEVVPSLVSASLAKAGWTMPDPVTLGPDWPPSSIPAYSLIDILRCFRTAPDQLVPVLADRLVFVGTWLDEEDRKSTSSRFAAHQAPDLTTQSRSGECGFSLIKPIKVAKGGTVAGVQVHAMAAETAITGRTIIIAGPLYRIALPALLGGVGALIGMTLAPRLAFPIGAASMVGLWWLSVQLLGELIWLPPVASLVALFCGPFFAYPIRFLLERARRGRIQRALGHYLSPELVARLIEDPTRLRLGGEVRELTVLFCDMRGFTQFSEQMANRPEKFVLIVNRLLTALTEPILRNGGTVDKYLGDAVMAFWNAPLDDPRHAEHALTAALEMAAAVRELNTVLKPLAEEAGARDVHFRIGIGINTGPAVVGNLGSDHRFDYTAIGDSVNVASRLEVLCKTYGVDIIANENVVNRSPGFAALSLGSTPVRGRSRVERIYVVIGDPTVARSQRFQSLRQRHQALVQADPMATPHQTADAAAELTRELPSLATFYDRYAMRDARTP